MPVRTAPGRGAVTAVSCWVCCCCCTCTCAVCCCAPCCVCCAACCWGSCSFCFCSLISCSCKNQTLPSGWTGWPVKFQVIFQSILWFYDNFLSFTWLLKKKWRWIWSFEDKTFYARLYQEQRAKNATRLCKGLLVSDSKCFTSWPTAVVSDSTAFMRF